MHDDSARWQHLHGLLVNDVLPARLLIVLRPVLHKSMSRPVSEHRSCKAYNVLLAVIGLNSDTPFLSFKTFQVTGSLPCQDGKTLVTPL